MRMLVLGATGGTGKHVVSQALTRGHEVTAFVRSPDALKSEARLRVVTGDPRDATQLARVVADQDFIVSALGAANLSPTTLLGDCARSTIAAMKGATVRRLLVVSSALLFPEIGFPAPILRWVFRNPLADTRVMEAQLLDSDLDWTIVRPPRLTNGAARGRYRLAEGAPPAGSITRADLASCLLALAEGHEHVRKVVGVSM